MTTSPCAAAPTRAAAEKFTFAETLARRWRIPLVRLVDGTGGGGSVKNLETQGRTTCPTCRSSRRCCGALAEVPVVALGLGSVAGMGAARVCASHYSLMVRGTSQLFAAGPPVVARAGQTLTKEELGGTTIHANNGTIDDEVATEAEAFARARRFLSYLPVLRARAGRAAAERRPRRPQQRSAAMGGAARCAPRLQDAADHRRGFDPGSFFEFGRPGATP